MRFIPVSFARRYRTSMRSLKDRGDMGRGRPESVTISAGGRTWRNVARVSTNPSRSASLPEGQLMLRTFLQSAPGRYSRVGIS